MSTYWKSLSYRKAAISQKNIKAKQLTYMMSTKALYNFLAQKFNLTSVTKAPQKITSSACITALHQQ